MSSKVFNKVCRLCGKDYVASGPAGFYCDVCVVEHRKASSRKRNAIHRAKLGCLVGVGSGNAQGFGIDHHSYVSGIKGFSKRKLESMPVHMCEECGLDLTTIIQTEHYMWVVHHVDHDRSNNSLTNLRLLCKRCHQVTHDCSSNFHKV